jgi:integrase
MAASKRYPTDYPGVYYRLAQRLGGKGEERVYYCTYKVQGKKIEVRLGGQYRDDLTPARAARMRADLIEGRRKSPQEKRREEAARPTIERLWHFYVGANTHKPSMRTDRYTVKHFDHLFSRTPQEISTTDVDALRKRMEAAGKSPQTVKNILELLRRIINFGIKKGFCQGYDPAKLRFDMPRIDNLQTECLTQDQLSQLLEALEADPDQSMAALMRLALATGMRRGALLALEWQDVDFEAGFITLRGEAAKSGKTTRIPMNPVSRAILEITPVIAGSAYVFPNPSGGKRTEMRHFLKRIQEAAQLSEGFRPLHGLRHTFASFLASSGEVDLYTLQRLLTHNSPMMTQRYAHLADEAMQRAAGVAEKIFQKTKK